jgi:hypothetical protein
MEYETFPTRLKGLNDSIVLSQTVTEFIFVTEPLQAHECWKPSHMPPSHSYACTVSWCSPKRRCGALERSKWPAETQFMPHMQCQIVPGFTSVCIEFSHRQQRIIYGGILRSQCHNVIMNRQPTANIGSNSELMGFWTLPIVRNSKYKKTQRFGNWICFRPQAQFPKRCVSLYLEFRTMDKVQNLSNSECHTT